MAFRFGGLKETTNPKNIVGKDSEIDFVIEDHHFNLEQPYYLYLLDAKPDTLQLMNIKKEIQKVTQNYVIVVAVNCIWHKEALKGQGISELFKNNRSGWRKFVNDKGQKAAAIMAFGPALYGVNDCADILTDDFLADEWVPPYYYLGHEIWKCDTYIYPVHSVNDLYPRMSDPSMPSVNYRTRFFYKQNERMVNPRTRFYTPDLTEPIYHIVNSTEEANEIFRNNMNAFLVAHDTETNGLKFYENHIHCLTICWDGINGYYIPWEYVNRRLFAANLMSCKHNTGANPKFDFKFYWQQGCGEYALYPTDATDMLAHAIHSDRSKGLKPQAFFFTPFGGYDLKLDAWKKESGCKDYTKIPTEILAKYATMDAIATWRVQQELWKLVDYVDRVHPNEKMPEWTIRRWYEQQMMTIYNDVIETEYRGIYVNWDLMNFYRNKLTSDADAMAAKLCEMWKLPKDFNFGSTKELGRVFEKMGFPEHGRSKAGDYVTDGNAIAAWIREGMPGVDILDKWRTESTTCHSFIGDVDPKTGTKTGWLQFINKHDEDNSYRVHQSYLVMGTTSMRFIGRDPNFQNVPTNSEYAQDVKRCIDTPTSDLYILTSDSGAQYRVAECTNVLTQRGYVMAKDITEEDTILENIPDKPTIIDYEITKLPGGEFKETDERLWTSNVIH